MISIVRAAIAAATLALGCGGAQATVVAYNNQASFQSALPDGYTLINLDAAPYSGYAVGTTVEDASLAALLLANGVDFVNAANWIAAGYTSYTLLGRNRLFINGTGGGAPGTMTINFITPVNGIGGYSNYVDHGRVRLFSGANATGSFLGETTFGTGGSGAFGGMTSTQAIGSAQFTCDGDGDLYCGVYDIQFGSFAAAVPEPSSWAMMIAGVGMIGGSMRRRNTVRLAPA